MQQLLWAAEGFQPSGAGLRSLLRAAASRRCAGAQILLRFIKKHDLIILQQTLKLNHNCQNYISVSAEMSNQFALYYVADIGKIIL